MWPNDGYLEYLKPILAEFQNLRLVLLDAAEGQTRNKVVLHAASRADTPIGEYRNEYMTIIQMTDNHRQIVSERIFSDVGVVTSFLAEFRNYILDKARKTAS